MVAGKLKIKHDAKAYQLETLTHALELVDDWSLAIDGGANVGQWTGVMAKHFLRVMAFEPAPDMYERLGKIFGTVGHVELRQQALWHEAALVDVCEPHDKPGKHRARFCAAGSTLPAVTVDSFGLPALGLLKLDLEGAELAALHGATRTLIRCRPVTIIEVDKGTCARFGHTPKDIHDYMRSLGAYRMLVREPDHVYGWLPNG